MVTIITGANSGTDHRSVDGCVSSARVIIGLPSFRGREIGEDGSDYLEMLYKMPPVASVAILK